MLRYTGITNVIATMYYLYCRQFAINDAFRSNIHRHKMRTRQQQLIKTRLAETPCLYKCLKEMSVATSARTHRRIQLASWTQNGRNGLESRIDMETCQHIPHAPVPIYLSMCRLTDEHLLL